MDREELNAATENSICIQSHVIGRFTGARILISLERIISFFIARTASRILQGRLDRYMYVNKFIVVCPTSLQQSGSGDSSIFDLLNLQNSVTSAEAPPPENDK